MTLCRCKRPNWGLSYEGKGKGLCERCRNCSGLPKTRREASE